MKKPQTFQMQSLVAFVEAGSLAKAAEKLHLTQPALSMQLKKLEDDIGYPLFDISGKRKILTPYGRAIFETSKNLLAQMETSFENLNRRFQDARSQTLKVACRRELIHLAQKKIRFAGTVHFIPSSSSQAVERLLNQEIDIAISRIVPDSTEIKATPFISNRTHLVFHEKLGKAFGKRQIESNRQFLTTAPAILFDQSGTLLSDWLVQLDMSVADINMKYICDDWLTILGLVEAGAGYSIIPNSLLSKVAEVRSIPLPEGTAPEFEYFFLQLKSSLKFPAFTNLLKKS